MSIKGTIYKEITAHLMANVPGIQHASKNRGQIEDVNNFIFPRPAVFISFGLAQYKTRADGTQQGTNILRVRTVFENYSESFSGAIDQDKAIEFFEFNENVHIALEGLQGSCFNNTTRISDEDDEDHTNLIVTNMEYEFNLYDDSTAHLKDNVNLAVDPELILNGTLQKKATQNNVQPSVNLNLPIIP